MLLPTDAGHPTDFDIFIGEWHVQHQRLSARLTGSTEWERFGGRTSVKQMLGGSGNVDDNQLELPGGTHRAATPRSFDPTSQSWSIWWLNVRNPGAGGKTAGFLKPKSVAVRFRDHVTLDGWDPEGNIVQRTQAS